MNNLKPANKPEEALQKNMEIPDQQALDLSSEAVDLEGFEGRISEVAATNASENQGTQKRSTVKTSAQVKRADLSDRILLREQLLKHAPTENQMRKEVKRELLKQSAKIERKVSRYARKRNYPMLEKTIKELRKVMHEVADLARLSYDRLREIWLQVVHHFA